MLPLEVFLPRLMLRAPGCPEPTAMMALLDSATEFCDRTRAIRVTTEPVRLVAGQAQYDMELPQGFEPLMVVRAWVGQSEVAVPPEAHRVLLELNSDLTDDLPGTPRVLLPQEGATMRLFPAPDTSAAGSRLTVRLAIRPQANATQMVDALFTRWRDAVIGGALWRLCSSPNHSYSNPAIAMEGRASFDSGVSQARLEATRDMSAGPLRVRNNPFA